MFSCFLRRGASFSARLTCAALMLTLVGMASSVSAASYTYHHRVMGLAAAPVALPEQPAAPLLPSDPYWASTILAINAENGLTDVSGHTAMTVMGSAAASPAQKKFGSYSLSVGGGTSYLRLPAMFMVETLSAPAWTIEFFFNTTHTVGEQFILSQGSYGSNHQFGLIMDSGTSFLVVSSSSGNWRVNSPPLSAGTWYHVALVMDKGVNSLYLNGVLLGSTPKAFSLSSVNPVTLGTSTFNNPAYAPFSGYLDDFRVTKAARYTSTFTVPTETFPTR